MATWYVAGDKTSVSNTTTETSLISSTPTMQVIAANEVVIGTSFRFYMTGGYKTTIAPVTIRFRVKFGSTLLLDTTAVTIPESNAGTGFFELIGNTSFRTIGASGTCAAYGYVLFSRGPLSTDISVARMPLATTPSVDTTTAQTPGVTVQWGAAIGENIITAQYTTVELIPAMG